MNSTNPTSPANCEPKNVGIRAMELYFPRTYVEQRELEEFDKVSEGKYTIGLGQQQMAFCGDHEDIASICMTVLTMLLERYEIDPHSIGFCAVGTETLIDKSKSVKTQLMDLFGDNTDVEGVDVKNACFGGTQALFHAVDWVYANWQTETKYTCNYIALELGAFPIRLNYGVKIVLFPGRYAVVVMGDIAIYEPGAARCTGGVGAFAALIGPDALISFDRGLRATHMTNVWDFYKPIGGGSKEFPVVNGPISLTSYMKSLDSAYRAYRQKAMRLQQNCGSLKKLVSCFKLRNELIDFGSNDIKSKLQLSNVVEEVNVNSFKAVMFHSPFCRNVQKAFARLCYLDYLNGANDHLLNSEQLKPFRSMKLEETYKNRDFMTATLKASEQLWLQKVDPYLLFNKRVGNMYTPSVFAQLLALFHRSSSLESIRHERILLFSYGSGAASAMFSATICDNIDDHHSGKKVVEYVIQDVITYICDFD
ncbi:unnamed protein product [Anisakis simplex]|uniref:Hydroxymethylglutaryl-CoA synthase (inferred by orthology to a C. elegans protein) n=1 Tax=Anisakis simplex TaxID=6269 RepID=A0A0M3J0S3_ANISI|nr:unnamed protein product [Anisakis simplex]